MRCQVCGEENPAEARFCANCGAALVTAAEQPAPEVAAKYAGFWIRFIAAIIDGIVLWVISFGLLYSPLRSFVGRFVGYGSLFPLSLSLIPLLSFPIAWLYYWLFTGIKGQTPGKMVVGIKVVDSKGNKIGLGTAALREIIGKIVSYLIICLGFLWIAFDKQKRGWHDIIANTRVVEVAKVKTKA